MVRSCRRLDERVSVILKNGHRLQAVDVAQEIDQMLFCGNQESHVRLWRSQRFHNVFLSFPRR